MARALITGSKKFIDRENMGQDLDYSECEKSFVDKLIDDSSSALTSMKNSRDRTKSILKDNDSIMVYKKSGDEHGRNNRDRDRDDHGKNNRDRDDRNNRDRDRDRSSDDFFDENKTDDFFDDNDSIELSISKEQRANIQINRLMSSMDIDETEVIEELEDEKFDLIERYIWLKDGIASSGGNIKDLPDVSEDDSMDKIRRLFKRATHRNNLINHSDAGGNMILMSAQGLGNIFNGKRQLFGMRPDLRGWVETVRPKLPRIRTETTNMVSSAVDYMGIAGFQKVLFELVPSMIVYANTKSNGTNHGVTQGDLTDAMNVLDE